MSDRSNTLTKRIKLFRSLRKMSQEDFSRESGISLSVIKKYEAGFLNPKIDKLKIIADTLGISLYSLMDIDVSAVNDIISILLQMDQQTKMNITGKKGEDGKYLPESIQISFDDEAINTALAQYLDIKETEKANGGDWSMDFNAKIDDIDLLIESEEARLLLNDEKVQRP